MRVSTADLLSALLNGETIDFEPKTNNQAYLKACCEACGCSGLPEPKTVNGALLFQLAEKIKQMAESAVEVEALSVNENGTYTAPQGKAYSPVNVNVPAPTPVLQEKTATENGEVTADSGFDGLSKVTVNVQSGGDPHILAKSYEITVVSDSTSLSFDTEIADFAVSNLLTVLGEIQGETVSDPYIKRFFCGMTEQNTIIQSVTTSADWFGNRVSASVDGGVFTISNARSKIFKAGTTFRVYVVQNLDWRGV